MALSRIGSEGTTGLGRRNLIINGAMNVAQRGTSSTSDSYATVDRFRTSRGQISITQSQQDLTTGDPYDSGFRHFYRSQNTSESSSASAYMEFLTRLEAQDVASSGWNYTDTNSNITLSFWARSSLAGTYYVSLITSDGTSYRRIVPFTLVADTWKKVEITVAGNSNLTFNNDNGVGLTISVTPYYGTTYTGGEEVDEDDWFDRGGQTDAYYPNYAQNWANTASATFDLTGVQLEVGSTATKFEHRSYGEELALCQRYFFAAGNRELNAVMGDSNEGNGMGNFPVYMRASPTPYAPGGGAITGVAVDRFNTSADLANLGSMSTTPNGIQYFTISNSNGSQGLPCRPNAMWFDAEL